MEYPLYILANDDFSIRVMKVPDDLSNMEQIDIKAGLYSGWDADGYPFKVFWDEMNGGIKMEQTSSQSQPEVLQATIFKYVESCSAHYRFDKLFVYDKHSRNFIGIIDAMRKHIESVPFKQKVINFFRRF